MQAAGTSDVLGTRVGHGLTWSFINNIVSRAGSVAAGIVLARLLVPHDYGAFAVALVVLNAILSMNELGVSLAVVRWPGGLDRIAPTVTTISSVSSVVLYGICFALAPFVADALNAADAAALIRVLCLCVLADGAAAVSAALITRAFDQRKRTMIDLISFVVGTALSVVLAVCGFGAWSMTWGFVASSLLASALTVALAPQRYGPGWDAETARSLLAFGMPLAASSMLLFVMLNVDYVVVGHMLGASALGVYLLAFNASSWPSNLVSSPVRRVSLAAFSRLAEQPARIGESFARATGLLLAVALPLAVLLASYAQPLVGFVYGAKWAAAADVLRLLCILAAVRVFTELAYDFLVALGRTRANLWLQVVWCVALVPALVVGARWHGVAGVATAHAVVALGVVLPTYLAALHRAGVRTTRLLAAVARPALGCALIAVSASAVLRWVPHELPQLAFGGVLAAALYLVVVRSMRAWLRTNDLLLPAGADGG